MKRFFLLSFNFFSICLVAVYLLACLTPIISPQRFWWMGILGLGFPILLAGMLLLGIIFLWVNKRKSLLIFFCCLLGIVNISRLFAWHPFQHFDMQKKPNQIRIMGYNVRGFDTKDNVYDSITFRHKIMNYISDQNPDILCVEDYVEYHNKAIPSNFKYLKESLGFNYYFIGDDYQEYPAWGFTQSGIALFSKYPLINLQHIKYPDKQTPESFIMADITIHGITRRLVVTHLQSINLNAGPPIKTELVHLEDSAIKVSTNKLAKLKFFIPYHAKEADLLSSAISQSPYPVIVSLDMNEVPTSYCYHTIKGKLNDVFLQYGFGLGRTYFAISPSLRIDYLFTDPSIKVTQYKKDNIFMSDHYPQTIDVEW